MPTQPATDPALESRDARHLAAVRAHYQRHSLALWQRMLAAWRAPSTGCTAWMLYAANPLFNTKGVRWAIDPIRPSHRVDALPHHLPTDALSNLSFVLLTHAHGDHFDPILLRELVANGVRMVVPEHLRERFREQVCPDADRFLTARPHTLLTLDGIRIEPFDSWHFASQPDGRRTGVEATGYRVSLDAKTWVFPGDVRDYDAADLSPFAPADILFAHLWLGRKCALMDPPPLLDAFIRFLDAAKPQRVVLMHLYEFSRRIDDLWHQRHLDAVRTAWRQAGRNRPIHAPLLHECVTL